MTLRCEGLAQSLGERHNKSSGITPLQWLDHFGTSLNRGSGLRDRDRPLPLICRAQPEDRAMTAYDDGQACPSLQNFLEVTVEEMSLVPGEGSADFMKNEGGYACRLRLLGNSMSRPPLHLGNLTPDVDGRYRASLGGSDHLDSAAPCMYPISHDLDTTLLVLEVGLNLFMPVLSCCCLQLP